MRTYSTLIEWVLEKLKRHYLLIIGFVALAFMHAKFVSHLEWVRDIAFHDEALYMRWGIDLNIMNPPSRDSLLYLGWYKILSLFVSDPVHLYYFNLKLLLGLPIYFIFFIIQKLSNNFFLALGMAAVFLVSHVNAGTDAWPFIHKLALVVILATTCLAMIVHESRHRLGIFLFGTLCLIYIRVEYVLSFFSGISFFLGLLIFWLVQGKREQVAGLKYVFWPMVTAGMVFLIVGSPVTSERMLLAFGQHFARNYYSWNGMNSPAWVDWQSIIASVFQNTDSVFRMILHNPHMFFKHIFWNVGLAVQELGSAFIPVTISSELSKKMILILEGLAGTVWLVGVIAKWWKQKQAPWQWGSGIGKSLVGFWTILFLSAAFSILFYRPETAKMLIPATLGLFMVIHFIPWSMKAKTFSRARMIWMLGVSIGLYSIIPFYVTGKPGWLLGGEKKFYTPQNMPASQWVNAIRAMDIAAPAVILDHMGGITFYLSEQFTQIMGVNKTKPFLEWVLEKKIDIIVFNQDMRNDPRFQKDPQFVRFIKAHQYFGFKKIAMPRSPDCLYIKQELYSDRYRIGDKE